MLPLVSDALAVTLRVEPCWYVLPFAGLVMATTGAAEEPVTVIVTGLDVVVTPLLP